MAGKEAHITNKPTGSLVLYNSAGDKFYVAKCNTDGVLLTKGEIDATIDFEVGHGKTLSDPASGTIASATTTAAIAAGGSGVVTYVYGVKITGISASINRVTIKRGTTQVDIVNIQTVGDALGGYVHSVSPDAYIFKTAANEAVNIVTSSAESIDYQLLYWQE